MNIRSSVLISGERDSGRHGTAHRNFSYYYRLALTIGFDCALRSIPYCWWEHRTWCWLYCMRLGREKWIGDKRFLTNEERVKNRDILVALILTVTKTKTTKVLGFYQLSRQSNLSKCPTAGMARSIQWKWATIRRSEWCPSQWAWYLVPEVMTCKPIFQILTRLNPVVARNMVQELSTLGVARSSPSTLLSNTPKHNPTSGLHPQHWASTHTRY